MDVEIKQLNELQDNLYLILNKYHNRPLTAYNYESLNEELTYLFNNFYLNDLKFKLIKDANKGEIIIYGLREIDKYALKGILSD